MRTEEGPGDMPSLRKEVRFLLDHTELHLVPTINPDGFVRSRYNPVNASSCVHR